MPDGDINEKSVTNDILEILKDEQLSISAIARGLQARGYQLNRLEVGGFLKALCEVGLLKTKVIAPAHVFSLKEG